MEATETFFDTGRHHIHLELTLSNNDREYSVDAILDTGAPGTELSDQFLLFAGFIDSATRDVKIKAGLQSQKYSHITLPKIKICGQVIHDYEVCVSYFEESWGIDALVGLDFFRRFKVEIDYSKSRILTAPTDK